MAEDTFPRRLSAILSADAVGYSRLMRDDEEATVRTITAYRGAMSHMVEQYRGRVVDSSGDNLLAEFSSVVDAVNCAVEIQRELAERNAELPEERKMRFRIGLNLGDVLQDGDRIYGDGVNVAARMEGLAEAGGICISGMVRDAVESKAGLQYEFIGEHEVKNIDKPIRAYQVLTHPGDAAHRVIRARRAVARACRRGLWGLLTIVLAGVAVAAWHYYFRPAPMESAPAARTAMTLPDKPSIAVLPFDNMSGDPQQEYFCDGMTDDLITDLSKISGLMVISRNSTFAYKGRKISMPAIAKELGVKYVLEGSIRRYGDEIRINAQLIDAASDRHLWADRFDGKNENVFDLQDRITDKIVAALSVQISRPEQKEIADKGTQSFQAYDEFLKGMGHKRKFTPADYAQAIEHFKKALKIDPNYCRAYAELASIYFSALYGGKTFWKAMRTDYPTARLLVGQNLKLAMKKPTSKSYQVLAEMEVFKRNFDAALGHAEQAVAIAPNDASAWYTLGTILNRCCQPEKAIRCFKKAALLDPLYQSNGGIGIAYFVMGMYQEAVTYIEKALKGCGDLYAMDSFLAVSYAFLGNEAKAKKAFKAFHT